MKLLGWRIYYGDGSVFSSLDGGWKEAPSENVQAVVVFYLETYSIPHSDGSMRVFNYRKVLHSQEYYWLEPDGPVAGDAKIASAQRSAGTVKAGGLLTKELFRDIYDRARGDATW